MRFKGSSQRYLAVLSACFVVYFWRTWRLHSLLDDVSARDVKDGKPNLPSKFLAPDEPAQVVRGSAREVKQVKDENPKQLQDEKPKQVKDEKPKQVKEGKPKPAQVVRPTPPPPDGNFSACLLIMDDNHFLIEWLAYHYHTLPLRHLIVSVDPRSKTSPTPIFDRWRKHGMDIVQWKDDDFMPPKDREEAEFHVRRYFGGPKNQNNITPELIQHRARQRLFYFHCMEHLKEQGRDWTLLIDSDEFVYVNYPTVAALNLTAPPINKTGSVMSFLKEELQRPGHNLTSPCVQMPRLRFGNQESEAGDVKRHVPVGFNASKFQTLRWRKHASTKNYFANRISKTMIDLSRVGWSDLVPVDSIHMPIRSMCRQRRLHIRKEEQVFAINHYLGTWEQYSYRDDSRTGKERSHEAFNKVARRDEGTDDDVRPWLAGFVQDKGSVAAEALLAGVGHLEPKATSSDNLEGI